MNFDLPSWMSMRNLSPSVRLTLPPAYFFKVPPSDIPQTLPPPSDHPTLAHPFAIPTDLYNTLLSPVVPITIALGYTTIITFLNAVNERRKYKPWAFSKTRTFKLMVITHNIILALYSAWTFVGMTNALRTSVYPPWEEQGLAGTVDSLCKIHGPRGPGSAAVYGESTSAWSVANHLVHLGADGLTPEATDVGRLWNQGLAFYGWLFYLSKFYEVLDTLIIIAKGRKSSFLQTFHHAGAMLCMWAGMRYMSAPIWMFVFVNSFIHSIMYTFYLFSAIGVRVPVWFKKTLTTLQITQFVIGAAYAFAHLFVKYESPVSVPYLYHLGNVASSAALEASSSASSVFAVATAVATDDWPALLKKFALRAAGREGLAQNVYDHSGHTFGVDATKAVQDWVAREETRYRDELVWTHCLDTSGQAFAILLNVVYLLPLTWLFGNFFIRSYLERVERRRSSTASQKAQLARESVSDAARRSSRRLSEAFEDPQVGFEDTGDETAIFDGEEIKNNVKKAASRVKKETANTASNAKDTMSNSMKNAQKESSRLASEAEGKAEEVVSDLKSKTSDVASTIKEKAGPVAKELEQDMADTRDNLMAQADSLKGKAQAQYEAGQEYVREGLEKTKNTISSLEKGRDGQAESSGGDNKAKEASAGRSDKTTDGTRNKSEAHSSQSKKVDTNAGTRNDGSRTNDSTKATAQSGNKESVATKTEGQDTNEETDELSPKEQVRQKDSNAKTKAEASTGDAKKDDSPSQQSSSQGRGRKTTASQQESGKEGRLEQNTGVKGSKGKNVANEEVGGQTAVKKAAKSARDTASNVVETVRNTIENPPPIVKNTASKVQDTIDSPPPIVKNAASKVQDTVENPPSVVKDAASKVQGSLNEAQDMASRVLQSSTSKDEQNNWTTVSSKKTSSRNSGAKNGQDYEDQKESWIHIQEKSEGKPARSDSPQWFERLTLSSTQVKRDAEEDKIINESELVRTEPVDQEELNKQEDAKKAEQDKIIDESEPVRDDVKDTKEHAGA